MTFQELKDKSANFTQYEVFAKVQVSPELATLILSINTNNRIITKSEAKTLAEYMTNDQWMRAGQTLVISDKGVLLDGQHRLEAVVLSGLTIEMIIVTGVKYEAFKVIDTGRKRSVTDLISVMEPGLGKPDLRIIYRVCRYIIHFTQSSLSFGGIVKTVKNLELGNFYQHMDTHEKIYLESCIEQGRKFYDKSKHVDILDISSYSFLYYTLSNLNKDKADTFFASLSSGENISKDGDTVAIYLLRDKLLEMATKQRKLPHAATWRIAYTFKAWNNYLNGTKIQRLLFRHDESFPIPTANGEKLSSVVEMQVEAEQTPYDVVEQTIEVVKGKKAKTKVY